MSVTIISLNVDSIVHQNRRTLLRSFMEENYADIYMLQETGLDNTIRFNIRNYNILRNDSRRGWGGVALLIRDTLPIRKLKTTHAPLHVITVEVNFGDSWIPVTSVYVPHHLRSVKCAFNTLFAGHTRGIIGGDWNSRHISFGDSLTNFYGLELLSSALKHNMDLINPASPTCFRAFGGSFIDKFIAGPTAPAHGNIDVLPTFSDHSAIRILFTGTVPAPPECIERRKFQDARMNKANRVLFRDLYELNIPADRTLTMDECEKYATAFGEALTNSVNKSVPLQRHTKHRIMLSSATRALQKRCKSLQHKLQSFNGLAPRQLDHDLRRDIAMLKQMIRNSVASETARFFSNEYGRVKNNHEAHSAIRRFTGHRPRTVLGGALYTDGNKTNAVVGIPKIAEALADRFESNHQLTHHYHGIRGCLVC